MSACRHAADGHFLVDICDNARHPLAMEDIVDARGLMCPLPVLKLGKVMRGVPAGTVVTLWADDPIAVIDIPHFCVEAGHRLVSQSDQGAHQIYQIERMSE